MVAGLIVHIIKICLATLNQKRATTLGHSR